jgi:alpha-glucosidase
MSAKFNSTHNTSIGNLTSWNKTSEGLSGETTHGRFRVQLYNDAIVRISITQEETFDDFSYAVIAQPGSGNHDIVEDNDQLVIKTSRLTVYIHKHPVRFKFVDLHNKVINEDDTFGTSWNGEQVTTYKKLQEGERFIGLGEKTGPLDRRGSGYQNWNTDSYAYGPGADPLYCTTPFYIGIYSHLVYGIFFDNSHKSFFNFGASNNRFASFAADAGDMNYYFISGNSVAEILQNYAYLTGTMPLPPLWSIGYQQCRYSYYPDKEVLNLANTFREKDIPSDAIVLDIHYMEKYKIFTWNNKDFPDPKGLLEKLKQLGFHIVIMCDPGIKEEPGYHTYDDGIKKDVFIKYPDGTNYTGQVWPGWCHFPDFTNPATRTWWRDQFHDYVNLGVDGFWNDMNEIATWGNMLPENLEMDFDGNKSTIRRGRNLFGFQMARSTYEGTKSLMKGRRPFNLTRSAYSGIQRYSAVWTGDNVAYDEHMLLGVRMVSSMGLAGIAFAGYDAGGFVGDANTKLFARWISIAAFSPFFRGHSMINSRDSEPWSYGEEVEQIARNYIKFRYKLLPYIYSLFYEASQTGMPLQRSLAIDYTFDHKIYDGQFYNQYLFGPYILVAPVESNKEFVKVYLPEGNWYYIYNGKKYAGQQEIIIECPPHKLPVFVKAGAILPMQLSKSNTLEISEILILHIYVGNQNSYFTYYEDDGSTFQHQEGTFAKRLIEQTFNALTIHAQEGTYKSETTRLKIVFHGFEIMPAHIQVNGNSHTLHPEVNRFFTSLEKFDPINDPEPAPEENVHSMEIQYSPEQIILKW